MLLVSRDNHRFVGPTWLDENPASIFANVILRMNDRTTDGVWLLIDVILCSHQYWENTIHRGGLMRRKKEAVLWS